MATTKTANAKHRFYISIPQEDDLRLEFDALINMGRTRTESFHSWMKHALHYRFDVNRGLWYTMR